MDVSCLNFTIIFVRAGNLCLFFAGISEIVLLQFSDFLCLQTKKVIQLRDGWIESDSVERRERRKVGNFSCWRTSQTSANLHELNFWRKIHLELLSGFFKLISLLERMLGYSFEFRGEFGCYGKLSKLNNKISIQSFVKYWINRSAHLSTSDSSTNGCLFAHQSNILSLSRLWNLLDDDFTWFRN